MTSTLTIIAVGIFAIGTVAGVIATVSLGIRREQRCFRELRRMWEQHVHQTTDAAMAEFLPEEAPDRLTHGARRLSGLCVRHLPVTTPGNV